MNDRLLSQEDHLVGQYHLPTKLQELSNDFQDNMYAAYKNDLTDKREYHKEMLWWKTKCLQSTVEQPTTMVDTLVCIDPTLYRTLTPSSRSFSRCLCQPQLLSAVFSTMSQLRLTSGNHEDRATLSSCSNARVQGQRLTGRPWLVSFAARRTGC